MSEKPSDTRRWSRPPAFALACCALVVAACGSSGHPARTASSKGGASALRFAACIRSHGVPNLPDPTANGVTPGTTGTVDKRSPAFRSALAACARLIPGGGLAQSTLSISPAQRRAMIVRAECMRAHGVPNFPDPPANGATPTAAPGAVNKGSPAFIAAANACGGTGGQPKAQAAP